MNKLHLVCLCVCGVCVLSLDDGLNSLLFVCVCVCSTAKIHKDRFCLRMFENFVEFPQNMSMMMESV